MKICICLLILITLTFSHNALAKESEFDTIPGRNFGYKNAIGPIYALNAIGHNIGVQYERLLDKKNVIAITSGIYYGWFDYGNHYNYSAQSLVLQTGIKVYPGVLGKRIQFAAGLDINYASGQIYQERINKNIYRDGLSLLLHGDMMLNMDKNVYFFLSLGQGVLLSSVTQRLYFVSLGDYAILNMQLSAGWRLRF